MTRVHAVASLAALALAACSPGFDGPEKVKGLRVLAVRAEPPEIGAALDASGGPEWPPSTAALQSLIGHPDFAAGDETVHGVVLHLACTPTPGDPLGTVCTQISALAQPSDLLQHVLADPAVACSANGQGTVDTVTFSGLEACSRSGCGQLLVPPDPANPSAVQALPTPGYRLPDDYSLKSLPAGNSQRVLGTDVIDLALALEAAPADLAPPQAVPPDCQSLLPAVLGQLVARWPERAHVVSLKWIHVRGPDMPPDSKPNLNPQVSGMSLGGAMLPPLTASPEAVAPGRSQDLLPVLPGDFTTLRQSYQRFDTEGRYVDTRDEDWAYSWFATDGVLKESHTTSWDERNPYEPKSGRAMLWLVVRDLRGGEAWTAGEVAGP
jgi:hypothetical protein